MRDDESTLGAKAEENPKKMTKAEFMVAIEEVDATLQKQIAQARENQREIVAKNEDLSQKITETRKRIEAL